MAAELPPQAPVIVYPYLWATQHQAGETEGRKARPSCLVLRSYDSNQNIHHLFLLAITSQPPHSDQNEIEIPDTERRRGGLTRYPRAWIIISEYNYDIAEHSYYFEPGTPPLGTFARSLAWISQTYRCIGAENLRKMLCCNSFSQVQESPDADKVYAEAV